MVVKMFLLLLSLVINNIFKSILHMVVELIELLTTGKKGWHYGQHGNIDCQRIYRDACRPGLLSAKTSAGVYLV